MKSIQIINTKGKQTIEASNITNGMGTILAYKESNLMGFVTAFNSKWKLHNHIGHTVTPSYDSMKELLESYPGLTFTLFQP